ncbi:hypothetical protein FHW19_004199 [Ochrobactrum anthropi]|uniref:DUF3597 domain-containing protein n=1 Tax=Brucella anthropi TaxID=529 RepID=UPI0015F7B205|nr:DUF3597 domain-containing protein [Brucella anthropi]MBA8862453.1 hypothetical protein [Brucella anthropi]
MGIFDTIRNAIFGKAIAAEQPAGRSVDWGADSKTPAPVGTASSGPMDETAVLEAAVAAKGQKLNWKTSIIDLMKALDLDSSLGARKELAKKLGFSGDSGDSAAMNAWLHKALMRKLAENGGQVPAELRH